MKYLLTIFLYLALSKLGLSQNNPVVSITEDSMRVIQLIVDSNNVFTTENMNFDIDSGWSKIHYYIGGSYFYYYTHYTSEEDGIKLIYESAYIKDFHPDSTTTLEKHLRKIIMYNSGDYCLRNSACLSDLNYRGVKKHFGKAVGYHARNYSLEYDGIQFYFKKGDLDYIELYEKKHWPRIPEPISTEFEFK